MSVADASARKPRGPGNLPHVWHITMLANLVFLGIIAFVTWVALSTSEDKVREDLGQALDTGVDCSDEKRWSGQREPHICAGRAKCRSPGPDERPARAMAMSNFAPHLVELTVRDTAKPTQPVGIAALRLRTSARAGQGAAASAVVVA